MKIEITVTDTDLETLKKGMAVVKAIRGAVVILIPDPEIEKDEAYARSVAEAETDRG